MSRAIFRGLLGAKQADPGGGGLPPGMLVWLDAIQQGGTDGVATAMLDQSGNGRHFDQAGGTTLPLWDADGLNGLPAWRWPDTGQFGNYRAAPLSWPTGLTAAEVFVVRRNATESQVGFWYAGDHIDDDLHPSSGTTMRCSFGSTTHHTIPKSTFGAFSTAHIYNVATAAGSWRAWRDGVLLLNDATNTVRFPADNSRGIRLGFGSNRSHIAGYYGWIGEMLVYPRVLADEERAAATVSLAGKWGIALP